MSKHNSSKNILIIDDDPIARMLAKRNLEIAGFTGLIHTADNGLVGYEMLRNSSESYVVLLDFHMPELDGIGLLNLLEEKRLKTSIFMLSSSILSKNQNNCLSFENVQEFMVKPIDQLKTKKIMEFTRQSILH